MNEIEHNPETQNLPATGAKLLEFIGYAAQRGYLNTNTAASLKSACREILSATEGDDWEKVDLLRIDIDDCGRRFSTLRGMKYSVASQNAYRARFKRAVEMFLAHHANPAGWKPTGGARVRKASPKPRELDGYPPTEKTMAGPGDIGTSSRRSETLVITYPFPLRAGTLAKLELPSDLSIRDADRIANFVKSLAIDPNDWSPPTE